MQVNTPTKQIIKTVALWTAVLVLLGVIPIFVNTAVGYIPAISVIFLMLICLVYMLVLKRSVSFGLPALEGSCLRGESLPFTMQVSNNSFLFATRIEVCFCITDVFGEVDKSEVHNIALPPRSNKDFTLNIRFDHIGKCKVGIQSVRLYDPLGVFSSQLANDALSSVSVEPSLVDLETLTLSEESLQETQANIRTYINDGIDYSSIREYRPGDPMRAIHWKLSSKAVDDYFTRLYETPTSPGLAIYLDFQSIAKDAQTLMNINDAIIESGLSLEAFAAAAGYDTEVVFVDTWGGYTRINGPMRTYRAMADAVPLIHEGGGHEIIDLLRQSLSSNTSKNNVAVCTSNITEEMVEVLIALKSPIRSPLLIAVIEAYDKESSVVQARIRRLRDAGIPCAIVESVADLGTEVQ